MLTSSTLLAAAFLLSPQSQVAQDRANSFVGAWTGTCADGKVFVIVTINRAGSELGGTVALANMEGADGQCATVVNPPAPDHAMKITDARLRDATLAFRGAGRAEFEMSISAPESATLKFLGTPVEENPWRLKKSK